MSSYCRLCLSVQTDIFQTIDSEILEKLKTCFCLLISTCDKMPDFICYNCKDFIDKANDFRKNVILNQEKIINIIFKEKEPQFTSIESKSKVEISFEKKETVSVHKFEEKICLKNEDEFSSSIDHHTNIHSDHADSGMTEKATIKEEMYNMETNPKHFKCLTCFENFASITLLRSHYRDVHFIPQSKKRGGKVGYSIVKKGDENITFKCDICEKSYDEKRLIVRHLLSHDENRPLICKVCGRTYKTVSEIIRHDRAHSDQKYDCSYKCGFSTAYTGALKVHERGHRTEYKYKCDKCDRGFHVQTWYLQHQNQHKGVKPFVCDICGLAFYMDKHLQAHRNKVHMESIKQQRFVCVHCMLPCASKHAMKKHLRTHDITSSFLCDICGKTLSSVEQLKAHKLTHVELRPYSCSTCNKSFARKFNLKLHEASHSGKKQHICLHCSKTFRQKSSLTRHIAGYHSTAIKCLKCEQIFISRSHLETHKKTCF